MFRTNSKWTYIIHAPLEHSTSDNIHIIRLVKISTASLFNFRSMGLNSGKLSLSRKSYWKTNFPISANAPTTFPLVYQSYTVWKSATRTFERVENPRVHFSSSPITVITAAWIFRQFFFFASKRLADVFAYNLASRERKATLWNAQLSRWPTLIRPIKHNWRWWITRVLIPVRVNNVKENQKIFIECLMKRLRKTSDAQPVCRGPYT